MRYEPRSTGKPDKTAQIAARETSFGHFPALDGLRAFAVASVVLFHAGVGALGGGFLGVDTFFVLSGFLITSLLLAAPGRVDLRRFWIRRARRLLPALLAMLLATVVAARFLLDPDALGLLRDDAYAALAYLANWRMIFRGTGYVAATAAPSPLQHTWSLGIEEQFYLLWPLLIAALTLALPARRARAAALLVLCGAGAVTSELLCGLLYRPDATARAYYGTDTRAQALLIGAGLAALITVARPLPAAAAPPVASRPTVRRAGVAVLAWAGVVVTGWLWLAGDDQAGWLFRGGLTVAALATAAVVAHVVLSPASVLARLLGLSPLVWLGQVSYGVYLWHWPLFTFVTADATGLTRWPLLAVRLAGTLAVATVSYHLIEQPIRHGALGRRLPRPAPAGVTVAALAVLVCAIGLATARPAATATAAAPPVVITTAPHRPVTDEPYPGGAGEPHPGGAGQPYPGYIGEPAPAPIDRPGRPADAGSEPRVTFLGDSVSWTIGTYLPAHPGIWTSTRAIEGCGIATLPDILQLGTPHTNYPGCTGWPARWQRGIDRDDPDVAVVELNRWELMDRRYQGTYQHVGDPAYDGYLTAQLDRAIEIAGSRGAAVVLLTAAYTHRAERPGGGLYPEDEPARVDAWNRLLRAAAATRPGVTVLDLNRLVCPGGTFTWRIDGLRIRSDGLHYTPSGVQRIIAPWLLPKLAAIATGTYLPPGNPPPARPNRAPEG